MFKRIGIIFAILLLVSSASLASENILNKAKQYIPQVVSLLNKLWPNMPKREIICSQIERESGWNPKATLKTSREKGMGFAQITQTFDSKGRTIFNNFKNAMQYKELKGWNWRQDPYNVKYQETFLILTDKSNYNSIRPSMINNDEADKAMLVMYNAGEFRPTIRRTYAKSVGIPYDRWDGGLELACKPSEKRTKIYGMSLCDTVNIYPKIVFNGSKKYTEILKGY